MKDISELGDDPRFISGIYNYCDRWCERCPFTSRCMVYAVEEMEAEDPATQDASNAEFWCKLESVLQEARQMIVALASERGVDLEELEAGVSTKEERRRLEEADRHELSSAARQYAKLVHRWLGEHPLTETPPIETQTEESGDDTRRNAGEALEVVRWYQHQISVKLMSALKALRAEEEPEARNGWQKQSDGSVKVALIAMDRSLVAWATISHYLDEEVDTILPILIHLEALRVRTEQTFPHARDFIRPGFDELPDQFMN